MRPVIGITAAADDDAFKVEPEYVLAVENSGGLPVILPVSERITGMANIINGLLLTGGDDIPPDYYGEEEYVPPGHVKSEKRKRIDFEKALLCETLKRGKPVLAVCYGMQLLNVAHGGTLFQDIECQIQRAFDHRKGMHGIEIVDFPAGCPDGRYTVNSTHHQAVKDVGRGLSVFAISGDGIIEGIYKRDYTFCVGIQWHPERIFYDPLSVWLFESLAQRAADVAGRG